MGPLYFESGEILIKHPNSQDAHCSSWIAFPENSRRGIMGHGSYQMPLKSTVDGAFPTPSAFVIIAMLPSFLMKKWKLKGISNFRKITAEVY